MGRSERRVRSLPGCPPWATATAIVSLLVAAGTGCATPEQRHRVLSFFFDGVPRPGEEIARPVTLTPDARPLPVARAAPEEVYRSIHEPECDECHDGGHSNRLRIKREVLCWECHDPEDFEDEFVHGPVASGQCVQCHTPHKSKHFSLLLRTGVALCAGCHDASTLPGLEEHRAEQGEDCVECHDPHAAPGRYLVEDDDAAS